MLNQQDRDSVERRLREERERAVEALEALDRTNAEPLDERAGEMSMYRFHMADIGTEAMEQEKSFLLASKEGERLYRIDAALRRLYQDPEGFGSCSRCGRDIGRERLELIPEGELCAECQREAEEQGSS